MAEESTTPPFEREKALEAYAQTLEKTPSVSLVPLLLLAMGGAGTLALAGVFVIGELLSFFSNISLEVNDQTVRYFVNLLAMTGVTVLAGVLQGYAAVQYYKKGKASSLLQLFQQAKEEGVFRNAKSIPEIESLFSGVIHDKMYAAEWFTGLEFSVVVISFFAILGASNMCAFSEHYHIWQGVAYLLLTNLFAAFAYRVLNYSVSEKMWRKSDISLRKVALKLAGLLGLLMILPYMGVAALQRIDVRNAVPYHNGQWLLSLENAPSAQDLLERATSFKGQWQLFDKDKGYYKNSKDPCKDCAYYPVIDKARVLKEGNIRFRGAGYSVISLPVYQVSLEKGEPQRNESMFAYIPKERTGQVIEKLNNWSKK